MKLLSFNAEGVYGYLRFDIKFNKKLNFLVGANGCGKTTALRLMQALLTPSLKELNVIPFDICQVAYDEKDTCTIITAKKTIDKIRISVSGIDTELELPVLPDEELEYYTSRTHRSDEFFNELSMKYADHAVFLFIAGINAPVFLGLERRHSATCDDGHDSYDRDSYINNTPKRAIRAKRLIKGSLGASLMETQLLVQDVYRRLRRLQDQQAVRLRDSILLSSFKYRQFDLADIREPTWQEEERILERRKDIEAALLNIGASGVALKNEIDKFFVRLAELFRSMKAMKEKGFYIEWLANKTQIDRVSDLIKIIDSHNTLVNRHFTPINKFTDCINKFYSDTGKTIFIDTVGHINIMKPNGKPASIEALSSGERQLLIIFAHLIFNEYGERSNVFIIDEPELSLHLEWQEQFVDTVSAVSSKTQFIMATHSPEIVGEFKQFAKNLSKRKN